MNQFDCKFFLAKLYIYILLCRCDCCDKMSLSFWNILPQLIPIVHIVNMLREYIENIFNNAAEILLFQCSCKFIGKLLVSFKI